MWRSATTPARRLAMSVLAVEAAAEEAVEAVEEAVEEAAEADEALVVSARAAAQEEVAEVVEGGTVGQIEEAVLAAVARSSLLT
mmetsp:Transcript_18583/g.70290  ORF Transcript_18583/g.70290 Transcript_18583/m.70290 type:complete len:84 (-) Transcript_18583:141-392(-)